MLTENKYLTENTELFDKVLEANPIEKTDDNDKAEVKHPYDAAKIDIRSMNISLEQLVKRLKQQRINLYPEYQRLPELWDVKKMSMLIESLLIRIPIPVFYFDGSNDTWEVVDGLQRLSALKRFMIDKDGDLNTEKKEIKTLRLAGLEYLKDIEGKTFDELPPFLQSRIEETQLMVYVINPGTPPEIKFNIFKRINTGGLILTAQEIRNALNQGIPSRFVHQLAAMEEFKQATNWNIPTTRMEDGDFVTRFIGFYDDYSKYEPDLDSYLNKGLAALIIKTEQERTIISDGFKRAMEAMFEIFGNDAFRKRYDINDRRKPINKALFDAFSVNLAKLNLYNLDKLKNRKDRFKNGFIELMNNDDFNRAVTSSTSDRNSVRIRFEKIEELISTTIQS